MDHAGALEQSVQARYSNAAQRVELTLCCPTSYSAAHLRAIPPEVLERDYGCGDPTPYARAGETVLDLGSGGGKVCFIAAQIVGAEGRVIGVDCNDEMLTLARRNAPLVAQQIGYANVEFRRGLIQDLRLDLDLLASELAVRPAHDAASWLALRQLEDRLRRDRPMIANESVDCVMSNCVLNLVRPDDRQALFAEVFRVLRPGGRAAISDIVSDEDVPRRLRDNPELWSGCVSGAFREDALLRAFVEAGFHGVQIVARPDEPWRVVEGIEFRAVTVLAHKGRPGPRWERKQAVIYKGPFSETRDDEGQVYRRGERVAVCDRTFHLLMAPPYQGLFVGVEPRHAVPLEEAEPFDPNRPRLRDPKETKGADYAETTGESAPSCGETGCCG